jgi:hypothetical protein
MSSVLGTGAQTDNDSVDKDDKGVEASLQDLASAFSDITSGNLSNLGDDFKSLRNDSALILNNAPYILLGMLAVGGGVAFLGWQLSESQILTGLAGIAAALYVYFSQPDPTAKSNTATNSNLLKLVHSTDTAHKVKVHHDTGGVI